MAASYSLNGSDYTALPVSARYAGSNGKDEQVIELESDSGLIARYTEFERGRAEFQFRCSATELEDFRTMIDLTVDVPFWFKPDDGFTYKIWRDNTYLPNVIDAIRHGANLEPFYEFMISGKQAP